MGCKHGNRVGSAPGGEYLCGPCERGESGSVTYTYRDAGKQERIVQRYNEAVRLEFQVDLDKAWAIFHDDFDNEMYANGYADVHVRSIHSVSGEAMSVRFWAADFDEIGSE